jgi:hypothetical protein
MFGRDALQQALAERGVVHLHLSTVARVDGGPFSSTERRSGGRRFAHTGLWWRSSADRGARGRAQRCAAPLSRCASPAAALRPSRRRRACRGGSSVRRGCSGARQGAEYQSGSHRQEQRIPALRTPGPEPYRLAMCHHVPATSWLRCRWQPPECPDR